MSMHVHFPTPHVPPTWDTSRFPESALPRVPGPSLVPPEGPAQPAQPANHTGHAGYAGWTPGPPPLSMPGRWARGSLVGVSAGQAWLPKGPAAGEGSPRVCPAPSGTLPPSQDTPQWPAAPRRALPAQGPIGCQQPAASHRPSPATRDGGRGCAEPCGSPGALPAPQASSGDRLPSAPLPSRSSDRVDSWLVVSAESPGSEASSGGEGASSGQGAALSAG